MIHYLNIAVRCIRTACICYFQDWPISNSSRAPHSTEERHVRFAGFHCEIRRKALVAESGNLFALHAALACVSTALARKPQNTSVQLFVLPACVFLRANKFLLHSFREHYEPSFLRKRAYLCCVLIWMGLNKENSRLLLMLV